jgi:hypothetical protein
VVGMDPGKDAVFRLGHALAVEVVRQNGISTPSSNNVKEQ